MATLIYTEKENGDLKLVAEIEDDVEDGQAVELLLEENPRLKSDRFAVLVGTLEDGVMSVVEQQEQVQVRWTSSRGNGNFADVEDEAPAAAPKRRGRPPGSKNKTTAAPAEDAPKRRRGRPPGSKNKASAAKPGPKAGTAKRRGRPPGSKNKPKTTTTSRRTVKTGAKRSGFKRNASSDE